MSSFTAPLDLRYQDGRFWEVLHDFTYHIGNRYSLEWVSVPAGFVTDFASVPRFFWRILPPTGLYGKAAVIHDWLYRTPSTSLGVIGGQSGIRTLSCTRKRADLIFFDAMKTLRVPRWKRYTLYWAVRLFGGRASRSAPFRPTKVFVFVVLTRTKEPIVGALVTCNGRPTGVTDSTGRAHCLVKPGRHRFHITKPGYWAWTNTLGVSGRDAGCTVYLDCSCGSSATSQI